VSRFGLYIVVRISQKYYQTVQPMFILETIYMNIFSLLSIFTIGSIETFVIGNDQEVICYI